MVGWLKAGSDGSGENLGYTKSKVPKNETKLSIDVCLPGAPVPGHLAHHLAETPVC